MVFDFSFLVGDLIFCYNPFIKGFCDVSFISQNVIIIRYYPRRYMMVDIKEVLSNSYCSIIRINLMKVHRTKEELSVEIQELRY